MLAYAPRRRATTSPGALAIVLAIHAAGLAALLLAKPDLVRQLPAPPTVIDFIDDTPPPPPDVPPPPAPREMVRETVTPLPTPADPIVEIPVAGPAIATDAILDVAPPAEFGDRVAPDLPDVAPAPVRMAARLVTPPHRLKPDYPPSKRRAEEEATLRLKLDIDAVGRVTRVTPVGSYDAVFLAAAERHILKHWRYDPATVGGDAVATSTTVSLEFRLDR